MVDLTDRQTQLKIIAVLAAILLIMFLIGIPPFDTGNSPDPPDDSNTNNTTPPTEPSDNFPLGASNGGVAPETLLETHRQTVQESSSLTYYYEYEVSYEEEREYTQRQAYLNTQTERYNILTENRDRGVEQYRTPGESYERELPDGDTSRINPRPAVPGTDGTPETNGFGVASFEERLTREDATFNYEGMTMFFGEEVHVYSTKNITGPTSDFTEFGGELKLYVHPEGYIMGLDGEYSGRPASESERPSTRTYVYTEVIYDVNETSAPKPDWAE